MATNSGPRRQKGALIIGGDFQGLGILRSLHAEGVPAFVIDHDTCISLFSRHAAGFRRCPRISEESAFAGFLADLVDEEGMLGWVVYPTSDEAVSFVSRHKAAIERRLKVPTPSWDVTRLLYDKRLTYRLANRLGIDIPRTWYPDCLDDVRSLDPPFPAIIKPAVTDHFFPATKAKAIQVRDHEEMIGAYRRACQIVAADEIMIQEVIPGGTEHQFSFCSLFKDGQAKAKLVARRARQHPMDFGHASTFVETVDIPELETLGSRMLAGAGYYGLSEVEFKRDPRDGVFKLLEVNARTWGWHSIGLKAGVNFSHLLFQDMMGHAAESNGYQVGVKWLRFITDVPTAVREIAGRRMTLGEYVTSLKGKKAYAVFAGSDPLPFLMEFVLMPYLYRKRGF